MVAPRTPVSEGSGLKGYSRGRGRGFAGFGVGVGVFGKIDVVERQVSWVKRLGIVPGLQ